MVGFALLVEDERVLSAKESLRAISQSASLILLVFLRPGCGSCRACILGLLQVQAAGMRLQSCARWLLALIVIRNRVSAQGN